MTQPNIEVEGNTLAERNALLGLGVDLISKPGKSTSALELNTHDGIARAAPRSADGPAD